MQLLTAALTGATDSAKFRTTKEGKIYLWLYGTTISNITLSNCTSESGTYQNYYPAGTVATYTTNTTISYDAPGGLFWKLTGDASTDTISIYVDGPNIKLV